MPEGKDISTKKSGLVKKFFKTFVDVKKWSSYDDVSASAKTTVGLYRRLLFSKPKLEHKETYEESVVRLGLSETQLAERKKIFLYSALTYLAFTLAFFTYFIYLLMHAHLYAAFFEFILMSLIAIAAYREHFWYMQMEKKKLGCNFYDWLAFVLRRAG